MALPIPVGNDSAAVNRQFEHTDLIFFRLLIIIGPTKIRDGMSLSTDHRLVATLVSRCEDLAATVKALQHENDALRAPAVSGSVDVDLDLDAQVQAAEAQLLELKQLQNEKRLQREKEGARTKKAGVMPHGTEGGLYDPVFMKLVEPLYDMHMGCENMGPMLYNLVRFLKPKRILEVGAGYTSIFILQALKDNIDELVNYQRLQAEDKCYCGGTCVRFAVT